MGKIIDLTGKVYGRLTVISFSHIESRNAYWNCVCRCGNHRVVRGNNMRMRFTVSCGCYHQEISSHHIGHGITKTHGLTKTKEYAAWQGMKERCYNVNFRQYKDYGGRGIKVCDRWRNSFENFLNDIGFAPSKKHSIDKIKNDGNYEPGNVRWATSKEQNNNTRFNRFLTHNGETKTVSMWCEYFGVNRRSVQNRLKRNLPFELIFSKERVN